MKPTTPTLIVGIDPDEKVIQDSKFNRFVEKLHLMGYSSNTIVSYIHSVKDFLKKYGKPTKQNVMLYKAELIDKFKPKTVNLKLQGVNAYLESIGKSKYRVKHIKIQQKTYLENVISNADYEYLKTKLKENGDMKWYFVVRFLGATGARISELLSIKVEHVYDGHLDLYTKGGKIRRIYIPIELAHETKCWLGLRRSGFLFTGSNGGCLPARTVRYRLQCFANRWGINPKVMHPHSFRHRYAKNFLEKHNDISLLADLMGHDSIETTRIYLRLTAGEQRDIVNKVVTW